jgi:ribosomal protein S8
MLYSRCSLNFALGIVLSKICQATKSYKIEAYVQRTFYIYLILQFLYVKGFILNFGVMNEHFFCIKLNYCMGEKVLSNFKIISKPSRRKYIRVCDLNKLMYQDTFYMISTSKGLLSLSECFYLNIGGEILCQLLF